MSDQIVINITPDPSINLAAVDSMEEIALNPLTLNQGLINHSVTHQKNGSDELVHNLLGGLDGGQSGQYYHMTSGQYANNVYRYDQPVYQTGAQTISGIKTFRDKMYASGIKFEVLGTGIYAAPAYEQGLLFYDDANHTLNLYVDNPEVTLQLGQENWVRVKNTLNVPIVNGDLVYIAGGVGANPYVQLAIAGGETTSATTLGMATHNISNNEFGYITTFGLVNNINTKDYAVGDTLYLSPTLSGKYTNVKPKAPQHMVRVGTVIRSNENNGVIFVNIQNGLEIEELHDVRINGKQNNQSLFYNAASGVWNNRAITTGDISGLYDFVLGTEGEFLTQPETDALYVSLTGDQDVSGGKNFLYGISTPYINLPSDEEYGNAKFTFSNLSGESIDLVMPDSLVLNDSFFNTVSLPRYSGELLTDHSIVDSGTLTIGALPASPYNSEAAIATTNLYVNDALNFKYSMVYSGGSVLSDFNLYDLHEKAYNANAAALNNTNSINSLESSVVYLTDNQTISGVKTFVERPIVNGTGVMLSGEAAPLPTTIVYQTGNQIISGEKSFINNTFFSGNVGINQTSPQNKFEVSGKSYLGTFKNRTVLAGNQDTTIASYTQSASNNYSLFSTIEVEPTANNSALYYSTYANAILNGTGNISRLVAFQGQTTHASPSTITQARGMAAVVQNSAGGTISNAYGSLSAILNTSTGTITNAFAAYAQNVANTGPITNKAGVVIDNVTNGTNNTNILLGANTVPSGNYSLYSASAYNSFFSAPVQAPNLVFNTGAQTISGNKTFANTVYIKDLYVTGTETIVNTEAVNVGSNYIMVNATGGARDAGIFAVTGSGLTGIADTGAIIGFDVPSNKWVFGAAARADDLGSLQPIASAADVSNLAAQVVYTTGDQSISGIKTFNSSMGIGVTTPTAKLDIADTWNNSGTIFTGVKLNITDTASSSSSLLMDLQANNSSKFRIDKNGNLIGNYGSFTGTPASSQSRISIGVGTAIVGVIQLGNSVNGIWIRDNGSNIVAQIGTNSLTYFRDPVGINGDDVVLARDAANILAQRRSTAAQTFRIYNTYTDASNYERGFLRWNTNVLEIGAEGAGSGSNRNISFIAGGATRFTLTTAGELTTPSDFSIKQAIPWSNQISTFTLDYSTININSIYNVTLRVYNSNYNVTLNNGVGLYPNSNNIVPLGTNSNRWGSFYTKTITDNGFALGIGNSSPISLIDAAQTWNSNITVTGASGNGTTATLTFATVSPAIPVGATIVVASVNPSGYNGTYTVTASTTTSVSYANATTTAWVSGGTIQQLFTAIKADITDTASNAASTLMDLRVGGTSRINVNKTGSILVNPSGTTFFSLANSNNIGLFVRGDFFTYIGSSGSLAFGLGNAGNPVVNTRLGFVANIFEAPDLFIVKDAANTLAQRNGANAQSFRIYNTYTDASNYERGFIKWNTNVLQIGTEEAGTGTARQLEFQTDGTTRMTIASTGAISTTGDLSISGHLSAATKSFKIPHQTKSGYLQYGVVESNEHGVYVRGETSESTITLPDHWEWLVDEGSITVQVTAVGKLMPLYIIEKNNKQVTIGGVDGIYNYTIYGTRKDVEPLVVEV